MRSVVVVLPGSMWAINPIFRTRSSGVCRDKLFTRFSLFSFSFFCGFLSWPLVVHQEPKTKNPKRLFLPSIVGEGLVGLSHLVRVFPLLDGGAPVVSRVQELGGQLAIHGFLASGLGVFDDPADSQGDATI